MKMGVHSRYGCFALRGERRNEQRKEPVDTAASVRSWSRDEVFKSVSDFDPIVADGNVMRVGIARVLRVYERPVRRPREIDPTNLRVMTELETIFSTKIYMPWLKY